LVELQLPLVADLPSVIERDGLLSARGFAVNDNQFSISVDPNVVDRAKQKQVGCYMIMLHSFEVEPPIL
jgi:hypothetical protein